MERIGVPVSSECPARCDRSMNDESRRLLEKGAHAIHSADVLLSAEEPDSAAGRAYYACFYVAKALLADRG